MPINDGRCIQPSYSLREFSLKSSLLFAKKLKQIKIEIIHFAAAIIFLADECSSWKDGSLMKRRCEIVWTVSYYSAVEMTVNHTLKGTNVENLATQFLMLFQPKFLIVNSPRLQLSVKQLIVVVVFPCRACTMKFSAFSNDFFQVFRNSLFSRAFW